MSSIKAYNPQTGKWEVQATSQSSEINVMDLGDNFKSDNVEGCLRELGENIKEQGVDLEVLKGTVGKNKDKLSEVEVMAKDSAAKISKTAAQLENLSADVYDHFLNHPGGNGEGGSGGGGTMPTITSNFNATSVEADTEVNIPIFFKSPNLGEGICYIIVNNIEVGTQTVKQGNNTINIGVLPKLSNTISLYVKDRSGLLSNQLDWKIVKGGVELSITFDSDVDYAIDDYIRLVYNVRTAGEEPIILHVKVDNETEEIEAKSGYNEYIFRDLAVGVHDVTIYATSGEYKSSTFNFNLVIVNSENLYVSSTFKGGEYEYGIPLQIPYRVSKLSPEVFNVNLYIDGVKNKELQLASGSYIWTISELDVGPHRLKIEASGKDGDRAELEILVSIEYGDYVPVKPITQGLTAWFDATERTNNDIDKEIWTDKSGNGVKAILHNFNYYTNGWINDKLVCDSDSYVEIQMKPYRDNVKLGSTIDILYKANNIGLEEARVLDYTDVELPNKGIYINIVESTLKSLTSTGKVSLDEDETIHLTYVIDRINKFGKIYINGVMCRAFYLSDTGSGVNAFYEDFSHDQYIYLNSEKGLKNFGSCEIEQFRVYNRALTDDEVLTNYIADIRDLKAQEKVYKFNYENKTTPEIRFYGDLSNMTDTQRVQFRIKYTSPNEELYGSSFDLPSCEGHWQGTSSLQYILKNYTIYLRDENLSPYMYSPYKNGILENIFCLKADYMESSHANNVGLAKFINDSVYDTKNPAQLRNPNYRNTVTGFPVLLYINDKLEGVYNFNLDRYSDNSYGYKEFDTTLCYEVSANSDTTAGAFHKWTPESGKTEHDYIASDFEVVYPPSRVGNDNFAEIKRLIDWVSDASDEMFRDTIEEYFNLEYLLRYYLTVMVIGAVDNLGKNMKLTTWDGLIWYPQFYDLDTVLGLD